MNFTHFGHKFARQSGIGLLMDDLTELLGSGKEMLMLGGGNPGHIQGATERYRQCLMELASDPAHFHRSFGGYGAPGGHIEFKAALVKMFNRVYGWSLAESNIAITNGSQNAFFLVFNLFGGAAPGQQHSSGDQQAKILLPLTPEYIGYEDVSIDQPIFLSNRPNIEILDDRLFKYRVNFDTLPDDRSINAICVSRPTNPTGNVITDNELRKLDEIAQQRNIPLIIDNAYGEPFPNIIHSDVSLDWHDNIILSMSLSKLGLPAVRTGIVIANEEVVRVLEKMNAIINLTPTSIGPAIVQPLFESGEIIEISNKHIKPFYAEKVERALRWFDEAMGEVRAYAHKPEGAIFLWLWFPDLPITAEQLYTRLKERGVLVVPGNYFFPGLADEPSNHGEPTSKWRHCDECIRISYAMNDEVVEKGIRIIGEEVNRAYREQ